MKKIIIFIFVMLIVISQSIYAHDLSGVGYGKSEKEAKKEALADLSSLIKVQVRSKFFSKTIGNNNKQSKEIKNLILTESDLPILGVQYNLMPASSEIMAEAHLYPKNVRKLYQEALNTTYRNIEDSYKILKKTKSDYKKYEILNNLLTYIDRYNNYKAVAILIGVKNIKSIPITESKVKNKLISLEQSVNSIDIGSKILAKGINYDNVYVFPATTLNSQEITPFASVLKDKLLQNIKTVDVPRSADYIYRGSYNINKNSIDVTYKLVDINGKVITTKVVTFNKKAYKNYRVKPQTVDFDRLLHQGVVLSDKLRVNVTTNKGSRDLIFKNKQNIEVLIKLNRPAYFYIIGHVNKKKENYSYLLELNEGQGNRKFIQRVSADDANKWISLGEFQVVPPFGVESIQVIASNKDLVSSVPSSKYDENLGLYIITGSPKKVVVQTRALRKKKSKKTYFAEDVLTFTTMKK
jgi:hypothetical protein